MLRVASVTTNAGMRPQVLMTPLTPPSTTPNANTIMTAIGQGMPTFLARIASEQLTNATIAPGERSIPPVRMTIVEPIAMIATVLTCRSTLTMFCGSRKRSVVRLTVTTTIRSATRGPTSWDRCIRLSMGQVSRGSIMVRRIMLLCVLWRR